MPDIRDILKGLSADDRALYTEARTVMRRAYLSAHAKVLPIEQYEQSDDQFLDMIDIKIAQLFDRAGVFNHVEGNLATETVKEIEQTLHDGADSLASKMIKQPLLPQPQGWGSK